MARMIRVFGLVLLVGLWAVWARGDTSWGILNAANASISSLNAQIAATTPGAASAAATAVPTALPTALPTAIPTALPTAIPTAVPTETPYAGTPTPTPVAATAQTFWDDGILGSPWGESLFMWTKGSDVNATVTDNIDGSPTVLQCSAVSGGLASPAVVASFAYTNYWLASNISNYYASGNIQADIELGPAFSTTTSMLIVGYGNTFWAPTTAYGCNSSPLTGLSTSTFTHVSIPFSTGFNGCDETDGSFSVYVEAISDAGYTGANLSPGVQFYVNNVQITPN